MASQEELNNQKQFKEQLEEILFLQRSLADEARNVAKSFFNSSTQATNTAKAFRDMSKATRDVKSEILDILTGEKGLEEINKTILKQKQAEKFLVEELNQFLYANNMEDMKASEILEGKYNLLDELKRLMIGMNEEEKKAFLEKNNAMVQLLKLYQEQADVINEQKESFEAIASFEEKLKKIYGGVETVGGGFNDVMEKLGGGKFTKALGIEDALKSTRKFSADLINSGKYTGGIGDKFKVIGNFVGNLGKNLLKALGPLTLITQFIQGLLQADKETTELQKSMALTKTEAVGFRMELMNAAGATGDINITSSKLLETFGALNKQFGFITNFATDTLVTMTKLTKVVGVSSESAGNLAAASEVTGTSFESNYKDVLATSYELQRQSGVQMDLRDILEQTGKVTGTVRANLGANPTQIAKAITQAKLFGASLEQVANAGKSLLQFEESISSELEAELLLGRDINLERARAAALAGDQVTLAQELQKEAGTFSDFTKMNVIQQEALAKAMGMQSDQLADILFQQEVQGKSARELRALGKEDLAQRVEAQTLQDRLSATMEKMQNLFVDLASGITPILFVLGKALSIVGVIAGMIQDIISGIGMLFGMDMPESSATVGAFKSLFGMETMDDGVIPTGYGETIIKKGKDTIALNNNDQTAIVAGTNLMGSSQSTPVQDNTETKRTNQLLESSVQALQELTKLSARPSVFQIGTDNFYTATSKYSYQVQ
jgi:hypothetical protein